MFRGIRDIQLKPFLKHLHRPLHCFLHFRKIFCGTIARMVEQYSIRAVKQYARCWDPFSYVYLLHSALQATNQILKKNNLMKIFGAAQIYPGAYPYQPCRSGCFVCNRKLLYVSGITPTGRLICAYWWMCIYWICRIRKSRISEKSEDLYLW